jgi:hypothetical protein
MTTESPYYPGTAVRLTVAFTDADTGGPTAPTNPAILVKDPSGAVTTYGVGQLTPGDPGLGGVVSTYSVVIVPTLAGHWRYRGQSDNPNAVAAESRFWVEQSAF